jgi:hypothetical protein
MSTEAPTRILVTTRGETGYLHTEVGLDLRAKYSLTLDIAAADRYPTRARAERTAARIADRFDAVELETV